jgi:polyisoprenyl-teichoic acid--peptidoglycan teichoic acid transferase
VYFPEPVRDRGSGLEVPEPGCVNLDGEQSLAFVRSRAYQVFDDGVWRTDPTGDLGRISRQQDFIRRALRRAVDQGARNPIKLDELIDVGLDAVAVDDVLTADDILALATRFRTFNPETLDLYSLPIVDDTMGSAFIMRMVDAEAQPLLDLFREDSETEAVSPGGVRVLVLNGSGRSGEAATTAEELDAGGFGIAGTGEAETFDQERTEIRYAPGQGAAADLLSRWLVAGADLVEAPPEDLGADVVLVTGADFAGVADEVVPPALLDHGEDGFALDDPGMPLPPMTSTTIGLVP